MNNAPPSDVDAMVREMRRANRRPLLVGLAGLGGVLLLAAGYLLSGKSAVAHELKDRAYDTSAVRMTGPFSFAFTGTKGTATCEGTFERLPFSSSILESCLDAKLKAATPPPRPENDRLAEGLTTSFAKIAVTAVHCPAIPPGSTSVTCTLEAAAGAPAEVGFVKTDNEWNQSKPARILQRATLAGDLTKSLQERAKVDAIVDCGMGLFGYDPGDTLTCSTTKKGAKKPGSVVVTFKEGGAYSWTATGT